MFCSLSFSLCSVCSPSTTISLKPHSSCFIFLSFFWCLFFSLSTLSLSPSLPCVMCRVVRYQHYFTDAWNTFDALIVVGSVVDIAITEVNVSTLFFCLLSWTEVLLKSQMLINRSVLFLCWVLVLRVVSNIRAAGPTWPRSPMFLVNKCFTAES